MKILVIFTGGTIQCRSRDGILSPATTQGYQLLDCYRSTRSREVEFVPLELFNILSENSRPRHWMKIARTILKADLRGFDGIIITHGTDTLPYTAAALGYTLTAVPLPVVLVSANQPLESPGCNALVNLSNAVTFIADEGCPGVYATYCNPDGRSFLHLGTRLTCALPYVHSFRSERDAFIAEFKNGQCVFNSAPYALGKSELLTQQPVAVAPVFSERVLHMRCYPGLNYHFVNIACGLKAIVHGLYHSGTACTHTTRHSLSAVEFAEACVRRGIPFYVAPFPRREAGEKVYETSRRLLDAGAIPLHDIAIEAALVKVMLAYGNEKKIADVPAFVRDTNIAHEMIDPRPREA
jgi:L-asparaginase/Glu-tRNA(Gln) amidotransferase subunit D